MLFGPLSYASLMAGVDILSLGLAKSAYNGSIPLWTGLGTSVFLYAIQPLLFYKALSFEGMAVINLLWNVISSFVVTLVGIFYFKEKLSHTKLIGVLFSVLAIGLLSADE
jgi:drug/metabolite transporter (DMT)-like permease